jgi:hypothetical protein
MEQNSLCKSNYSFFVNMFVVVCQGSTEEGGFWVFARVLRLLFLSHLTRSGLLLLHSVLSTPLSSWNRISHEVHVAHSAVNSQDFPPSTTKISSPFRVGNMSVPVCYVLFWVVVFFPGLGWEE